MIDTATAVQKAVFAALNSSSAVTNLAPVWQNAPEDTQPPLVIIGDVSLEPIGGKDGGFDRATFEVLTFVREPDQTELFALQAAVRNALEDMPISTAGAMLSNPNFISSESEPMEDGETYMGVQRFETLVQPWLVSNLFTAAGSYWFDPSDLSTLYQSGTRSAPGTPITAVGQTVGLMLDKSGFNNDFTQATLARRPTYQVDGNGKPYLLFDGVDDNLNGVLAGGGTLPFDRVSAIQMVAYTNTARIWATSANDAGWLLMRPSFPNLEIRDGITGTVFTPDLAVGVNGIVTERHAAGASKIAINNGAYVTGNAGSNAPGPTIFLGAQSDVGANASNIRFYGVVRVPQLTDADLAQLRVWLGAQCGVSIPL